MPIVFPNKAVSQTHVAAKMFRESLALSREIGDKDLAGSALENLAITLVAQGDLAEAEQHLEKALRVDERHAKAHLQMGVLRKVQGKRDVAKTHFERVLVLAPKTDASREAEVHLKKM